MKNYLQKSISLVIALIFNSILFAQVNIQWSDDLDAEDQLIKIMGEDEEGVITLSGGKKGYSINNYKGSDLTKKYSALIQIAERNDVKVEIEDVFYMEDNIIVVVSGFDSKNDLAVSYGLKYNKSTGSLNQRIISLSEVEVESKRRSGSFGMMTSENGKYLMVYHYALAKKSQTQQLHVTLYDAELNLINEYEKLFDLNDKNRPIYGLSNFMVDDKANIFYLKSNFSGTNDDGYYLVSQLAEHDYEENQMRVELVSTDEGLINVVVGLKLMSNGEHVFIGGYYMQHEGGIILASRMGVDGTFYSEIDPAANEVVVQSKSPFDDDLKSQILTRKQVEKGRKIPTSFYIKDMVLLENGEMIIVSEQFVYVMSQSGRMQTEKTIYGSIIVTKVNGEGEIAWNRAIVKTQVYTEVRPVIGVVSGNTSVVAAISLTKDETIYYSYLMGVGKDDFYFVYNDNVDNFNLSPEDHKKLTKPKNGVPAIVTISEDGEMKKIPGYSMLSADVILRPRISRQVSDNEVFVFASRKKVDKIGRITFD